MAVTKLSQIVKLRLFPFVTNPSKENGIASGYNSSNTDVKYIGILILISSVPFAPK